jgi:hypothetical protein
MDTTSADTAAQETLIGRATTSPVHLKPEEDSQLLEEVGTREDSLV